MYCIYVYIEKKKEVCAHMWTYKYLCIAPSLGLLQRSNLQRVCVSAVMTPARCCPISQECPAVLVTLLLQTVICSLPAAVEKGKLSEVGLTLEGLGAPVGSPGSVRLGFGPTKVMGAL